MFAECALLKENKMVQPFPLYDKLYQRVTAKSESVIELKKICATINSIDEQEHNDIIFALIYHHEMKEVNGIRFKAAPYGGVLFKSGKGTTFDMTKIPPILQKIIAEYIQMASDIKTES